MMNAQSFWCGSPVIASVGSINPQRSQGVCIPSWFIMKITKRQFSILRTLMAQLHLFRQLALFKMNARALQNKRNKWGIWQNTKHELKRKQIKYKAADTTEKQDMLNNKGEQYKRIYRIYPCISRPFTASKSVQKIALDLYMGQKPKSKKVRDKLA